MQPKPVVPLRESTELTCADLGLITGEPCVQVDSTLKRLQGLRKWHQSVPPTQGLASEHSYTARGIALTERVLLLWLLLLLLLSLHHLTRSLARHAWLHAASSLLRWQPARLCLAAGCHRRGRPNRRSTSASGCAIRSRRRHALMSAGGRPHGMMLGPALPKPLIRSLHVADSLLRERAIARLALLRVGGCVDGLHCGAADGVASTADAAEC